jgi:glutamate racemase
VSDAPPPSARARPIEASAPLGVFDSGLGGLTVVRALRAACPGEDIVYLGDTARVPYGTRSPETVIRYALGCARVLSARGVKAIIVACNTVSAVAIDALRIELDLPVLGVIQPGARAAVAASGDHPIGVLATAGTIASGAYPRAILGVSTRAEVLGQPASLLVSLAEEGWLDGTVPELVIRRYVEPLLAKGARTLVLGCTHFPLFRDLIEREATALAGRPIAVVRRDVLARPRAREPERPRGEPRSLGHRPAEELLGDRVALPRA